MERYDPQKIEPKWQQVWEDERAWEVSNEPGERRAYVLEQLPYPSGTLHVGHLLVYSIGDIVSHFRRRNGYETLHPFGFSTRTS